MRRPLVIFSSASEVFAPILTSSDSCSHVAPQNDKSNRILRKYREHQHHFLRITFTEEGGHGHPLRHQYRSPTSFEKFVETHVGNQLRSGIKLAGRTFEWLGYSSSGLKERQMLFMTPFTIEKQVGESETIQTVVCADTIRTEMGQFDPKLMRQPAKYGARLSLVKPNVYTLT